MRYRVDSKFDELFWADELKEMESQRVSARDLAGVGCIVVDQK